MRIELKPGVFASFDDADWPLVCGFDWQAITGGRTRQQVYAVAVVRREDGSKTFVRMHRLISGVGSGQTVDHIDHDTLNNSRANLRVCSHSENACNTKAKSNNLTGVRNVALESCGNGVRSYRATVALKGKRLRKRFPTLEAASEWAEKTRSEMHGAFAYGEEQDKRLRS